MRYRYRCTNRKSGPKNGKPLIFQRATCAKRFIFTKAKHDRAQTGETFYCTCGYKVTFVKADYVHALRQVCNCGGRPRAHRRGQKGCQHDARGFATEDEYRDYINSMQAAFS